MIKAIETPYNGYRFRSRLEARWAVFFDTLGIRYKYEEYGFEQDGYRWLPDFYLPDYGVWVEVKGGKPSVADAQKMGHLLDFTSPLPFFCGCRESPWNPRKMCEKDWEVYGSLGGQEKKKFNPGLILLGEVPNPGPFSIIHPFIRHESGLCRDQMMWTWKHPGATTNYLQIIAKDCFVHGKPSIPGTLDGYAAGDREAVEFFSPDVYSENLLRYRFEYSREHRYWHQEISQAYTKARGARFEHGETPC